MLFELMIVAMIVSGVLTGTIGFFLLYLSVTERSFVGWLAISTIGFILVFSGVGAFVYAVGMLAKW